MAHDLVKRTARYGETREPRLGRDEVFGIVGPDEHNEYTAYAAMKQGGRFRAIYCRGWVGGHDGETVEFLPKNDTLGILYGPVHSSMTIEDVEGARHAIDTGTHWVFSHASPAEHHEFASLCEAQALLAIQPALNFQVAEFMSRTGPLAVDARAKFQSWRAFAERTQHFARTYALVKPLGHWERNRDLHHMRSIVGKAMAAVLNEWKVAKADTNEHRYYNVVRNDATSMSLKYQQAPKETIKTWPTHRAEVAAAEAAKKKAAETESGASMNGGEDDA